MNRMPSAPPMRGEAGRLGGNRHALKRRTEFPSNHVWQIGPVGTASPAIRYFDSGDSVLLGAGGVACSG